MLNRIARYQGNASFVHLIQLATVLGHQYNLATNTLMFINYNHTVKQIKVEEVVIQQ